MLSMLAITGLATVASKEWVEVEGTSATTLVGVGAQSGKEINEIIYSCICSLLLII